jgi:hypothetical protein
MSEEGNLIAAAAAAAAPEIPPSPSRQVHCVAFQVVGCQQTTDNRQQTLSPHNLVSSVIRFGPRQTAGKRRHGTVAPIWAAGLAATRHIHLARLEEKNSLGAAETLHSALRLKKKAWSACSSDVAGEVFYFPEEKILEKRLHFVYRASIRSCP